MRASAAARRQLASHLSKRRMHHAREDRVVVRDVLGIGVRNRQRSRILLVRHVNRDQLLRPFHWDAPEEHRVQQREDGRIRAECRNASDRMATIAKAGLFSSERNQRSGCPEKASPSGHLHALLLNNPGRRTGGSCARRAGRSARRASPCRSSRRPMQIAQQLHHGFAVRRVQVSGGLVREQDGRLAQPARAPRPRAAADRPRAATDSASSDAPCRPSPARPAPVASAPPNACRDRSAAARRFRTPSGRRSD